MDQFIISLQSRLNVNAKIKVSRWKWPSMMVLDNHPETMYFTDVEKYMNKANGAPVGAPYFVRPWYL